MTMMTAAPPNDLDPDDVSACPVDVANCSLCLGDRDDGRVGQLLEVVTASTPVGIGCFVVCDVCALGPLPTLPIGAALRAVLRHAEHLDADLDEIAAAVAAKDAR